MDATGDTIEAISDATDIDSRIISGIAAAAETAVGGRSGAARRLTTAGKAASRLTRQGSGTGVPRSFEVSSVPLNAVHVVNGCCW